MSARGFNLAKVLIIGVSALILIASQLALAEGIGNGSGKDHGKNITSVSATSPMESRT